MFALADVCFSRCEIVTYVTDKLSFWFLICYHCYFFPLDCLEKMSESSPKALVNSVKISGEIT